MQPLDNMSGLIPVSICDSSRPVQRLDFRLPDVVRVSWVSDRAREVWLSRFHRVALAWEKIELLSVISRIRACALFRRNLDDVGENTCIANGLFRIQLSEPSGQSFVAAGYDRTSVGALVDAWSAKDHATTGQLLGYPPCCATTFCDLCVAQGWSDPTWPMCLLSRTRVGDSTGFATFAHPSTNMLWRRIGIRATPHLPCNLACDASVALSKLLCDLGVREGYSAEVDWLQEILHWRVQWSALHGIAELKTPVLKLVMNTDATDGSLDVRWSGPSYPPEGARGVGFPYNAAPRRLITDSPGFRRGIEQSVSSTS